MSSTIESSDKWIEIRDKAGKLLFKYNPTNNSIELKRGGDVYFLVKLDEIRSKYGYIPYSNPLNVIGAEVVSGNRSPIGDT